LNTLKKIIGKILDFFIFSNLLIAMASFLFTLQTALIFKYSASATSFFAITNFISTFILYNLQRIYQSTKPHSDSRLFWYDRYKKSLFTIMLVFLSLYVSIFQHNYLVYKEGLLLYIPIVVLSLFYFLPPFVFRKAPLVKILIIAFVWVYSSIFIPLTYSDHVFVLFSNLHKNELAYLLAQFCFIAAICIPFDIRDIESDRQYSVKTLPVHFGLSKAKTIGMVLLILFMALAQDTTQAMAYFVTGGSGILLTYFSSQHKHRYYFSVLVDGLIILQFVIFTFLFTNQ